METITILLAILQSMAISLGVGSSTLAVLNFFIALRDGKIGEDERALMGIVYIVLRVAMVLILITTALLAWISISTNGFNTYLTDFKLGLWTLIVFLYVNSFLMTKHLISSAFGPAIQAGTWYTMGGIMALLTLNLHNFSYFQFGMAYISAVIFAVIVINSTLMYLKHKRTKVVQN